MGKRLVLISSTEFNNYLSVFGVGLNSNEIFTIQQLEELTEEERDRILYLTDGDAVLLIGGDAFKYLRQKYHFGIRNENYADCAKLRRLSIDGGSFAKCILDLPSSENDERIIDFMNPSFSDHRDFSWFKQKVLHTFEESMKFLDYIDSLPLDTPLGFDYEASGMALDKWFELSGASICTTQYGGFISFTDVRHNTRKEYYVQLLKRLGNILEKRQDYIWVYNMLYEFQVSHRMLGVDLYNLCDASSFNVLDGNHLKKYSLKYTANLILQSTVWDTEFDRISDLIDSMLFDTVGKLKREKHKVLKVTKDNFKETREWKILCNRYPNYINEFENLILEYWGNPFMCIPSDILGYYCNLDAFYTLMIAVEKKKEYSEEAIQIFLDNTRLATRLFSSGLYIDEDYRLKYQKECHKMMAWGITYCASARCKIKMEKHEKKMANIEKYNPFCKTLIETEMFFNGNPVEISKNLLIQNIDTLDVYDTGINEGGLLIKYGKDFANGFINIVKESMKEIKFKGKIDSSVKNKRKLISTVATRLSDLLELNKLKIGNKHIELEKYIYYKNAYVEFNRIIKTQMPSVNEIPDDLWAFNQKFSLLDYANFVSNNYFKCKSSIENDIIITEMFQLYKYETAFLASLSESVQQLPGKEKYKFFEDRNIKSIEDAYFYFLKEWENYYKLKDKTKYTGELPIKIYQLALYFWTDGIEAEPSKDVHPVKDVWSDFSGFSIQSDFFSECKNQIDEYSKPFLESDLDNNFFFIRKFVINYLLFKKYSKVLSTYIDGMFKANNKWVIEGEDHIPLREADPDEPGAIEKCFVHYEVNTKKSKRWSSGFHTIISHSDLKDCLVPPYHYENGIKVEDPFIETYFDISSAEVKAAGFASKDPDLIDKFRKGEDIYIYSAKLYLGDAFDRLDDAAKKAWRKKFKTVFLGVLYGLGKKSLAERLNCSEEEAEHIIQGLYKSFPKLREYVEVQQQYPLDHDGYLNTMLGDKLHIEEYDVYVKALQEGNEWLAKNMKAKVQRRGVNYPIQGGTSSIMASGFMNNIRVSIKEHWKNALQPIIVVHDSNTNYVPVEKFFEIRKFYDKNYTEYCANNSVGITLLFDLLAGQSYERAVPIKMIDDNTVECTGSAYSLLGLYDKLVGNKNIHVICNLSRDELIPKFVSNPIERFIREKGTSIIKDLSKYTIQFKKID